MQPPPLPPSAPPPLPPSQAPFDPPVLDTPRRQRPVWVVPVAVVCLSAAAIAAYPLLRGFMTFNRMMAQISSDSDASYAQARTALGASPGARAQLGTPMRFGDFMSRFDPPGPDGRSLRGTLDFAVSGPRGTGDVEATVDRRDGRWQLVHLTLTMQGQAPLDLVAGGEAVR
jgi:Cytochrome oxidase complex assembly protein 1